MKLLRGIAAVLVLFAALAAAAHGGYRLSIAPEPVARAGVVVTFSLPPDLSLNVAIRDGGALRDLQVGLDRRATFVLPEIKANERRVVSLEETPVLKLSGGVRAEVSGDQVIKIDNAGAPVFSFWGSPEPLPAGVERKYLRSGHIHPVRSPSGAVISASYAANHPHHHGIWAAWTKAVFQGRPTDFWNMGRNDSLVESEAVERAWSGPVHGGFVSRQLYVDYSSGSRQVALNEKWEITVYHLKDLARPVHVFDLHSTQQCAGADPLVLPEYHYGGVAFRGLDTWDGAENFRVLTSEGETDRVKANTSRVRWCHVGGKTAQGFAGIAMLSHPENFRVPQPIRVHPTEPYFCFIPSQLGQWEIRPGTPYVARYRFVVLDGEPDRALLDAYWNGYAHPARVTVDRN